MAKTKKVLDREGLRKQHDELRVKCESLAKNLHQALRGFLHEAGIDVLDVTYRIKEFDSFWEKVERNDYGSPLEEMEDICGLRIVCFYPSDLDSIGEIIAREFDVHETTDKAELMEPDRFGYRSQHFIVSIKKEWLKAPNYRGLGGLKAEIQVRTILMHAWADISHKLAYKKKEHVPNELKRRLNQLSALFELADEQFDLLRKQKEAYKARLVSVEGSTAGIFDASQPMNLDSLQALLDLYFPGREKSERLTRPLVDELQAAGVSLLDLVEAIEKVKGFLPAMEMEYAGLPGTIEFIHEFRMRRPFKWAQVGIARQALEIGNEKYRKHRLKGMSSEEKKFTNKWSTKVLETN
jgi:putative GTP pyrophosphokinase